jgi:hypothetical protein
MPQSTGHVVQSSPAVGVHTPSPQPGGHGPQSIGHVVQLSPAPQIMSPQVAVPHILPHVVTDSFTQIASHAVVQQYVSVAQIDAVHMSQPATSGPPFVHSSCAQPPHAPQSAGHDMQVSPAVAEQVPSPHVGGQTPQSTGQFMQSSVPPHTPSPHDIGHLPQSAAHVAQVSPPRHLPSPQKPRFASGIASTCASASSGGASIEPSIGRISSHTPSIEHDSPEGHGIVSEHSTVV